MKEKRKPTFLLSFLLSHLITGGTLNLIAFVFVISLGIYMEGKHGNVPDGYPLLLVVSVLFNAFLSFCTFMVTCLVNPLILRLQFSVTSVFAVPLGVAFIPSLLTIGGVEPIEELYAAYYICGFFIVYWFAFLSIEMALLNKRNRSESSGCNCCCRPN